MKGSRDRELERSRGEKNTLKDRFFAFGGKFKSRRKFGGLEEVIFRKIHYFNDFFLQLASKFIKLREIIRGSYLL